MIQVQEVQPHMGHVYLICVASAVSFGITEITKPFIFKTCDDKSNAVVRLFAVITGAVVGWSLSYEILDLWLGASAGALNAFIVKIFKKKVQSHLGVDETPKPKDEEK